MTKNGASQELLYFDKEYDSVTQVEDEVRARKNIIMLKRQKWKDIKEEEKVKEAEKRRRQEKKDDDDARDQTKNARFHAANPGHQSIHSSHHIYFGHYINHYNHHSSTDD